MYREEPDFPELADLFSDIRQETALCERLLGIRAELCRIPEGIDILLRSGKEMAQCADSPFDSTFGQVLCRELSRYQKAGTKLLTRALAEIESEEKSEDLRLKFGPLYSEALHRFEEIGAALVEHDYERARLSLAPFSARVGLKRPKTSAEFDRLKNTVSLFLDSFKKFSSLFFPYTKEELTSSAGRCERVLLLLHRTLSLFEEAYRAAKMTREIAEFSDVSRAAYSLLVLPDGSPSPLALSMRDNYDAIYIDEYQDVDAMQDATLCAISKENNRFMVGRCQAEHYAFPRFGSGYFYGLSAEISGSGSRERRAGPRCSCRIVFAVISAWCAFQMPFRTISFHIMPTALPIGRKMTWSSENGQIPAFFLQKRKFFPLTGSANYRKKNLMARKPFAW